MNAKILYFDFTSILTWKCSSPPMLFSSVHHPFKNVRYKNKYTRPNKGQTAIFEALKFKHRLDTRKTKVVTHL